MQSEASNHSKWWRIMCFFFVVCTLTIFHLYPVKDEEKEQKIGLRIKNIYILKFFSVFKFNSKLNFVFFGINLRTCLTILILVRRGFLGWRPKTKIRRMPKCTPRLMGLTPYSTFAPTDLPYAFLLRSALRLTSKCLLIIGNSENDFLAPLPLLSIRFIVTFMLNIKWCKLCVWIKWLLSW